MKKDIVSNRVPMAVLIVYCTALFVVWCAFEMLIFPQLTQVNFLKNAWLSSIVKDGIIKNIVWTLPAALLVVRYKEKLSISAKEMFTNRVNWLKYLPVFAFFTAYLLIAGYMVNGKIAISSDFGPHSLIIVAFAGITEEGVFRGWILNATISEGSKKRTWLAVIFNALFFLIIHFPRWIHEGIFVSSFADLGFLCIIMLGIVFSQTFIRSKSLFVPIVLHIYWDLLAFLFV